MSQGTEITARHVILAELSDADLVNVVSVHFRDFSTEELDQAATLLRERGFNVLAVGEDFHIITPIGLKLRPKKKNHTIPTLAAADTSEVVHSSPDSHTIITSEPEASEFIPASVAQLETVTQFAPTTAPAATEGVEPSTAAEQTLTTFTPEEAIPSTDSSETEFEELSEANPSQGLSGLAAGLTATRRRGKTGQLKRLPALSQVPKGATQRLVRPLLRPEDAFIESSIVPTDLAPNAPSLSGSSTGSATSTGNGTNPLPARPIVTPSGSLHSTQSSGPLASESRVVTTITAPMSTSAGPVMRTVSTPLVQTTQASYVTLTPPTTQPSARLNPQPESLQPPPAKPAPTETGTAAPTEGLTAVPTDVKPSKGSVRLTQVSLPTTTPATPSERKGSASRLQLPLPPVGSTTPLVAETNPLTLKDLHASMSAPLESVNLDILSTEGDVMEKSFRANGFGYTSALVEINTATPVSPITSSEDEKSKHNGNGTTTRSKIRSSGELAIRDSLGGAGKLSPSTVKAPTPRSVLRNIDAAVTPSSVSPIIGTYVPPAASTSEKTTLMSATGGLIEYETVEPIGFSSFEERFPVTDTGLMAVPKTQPTKPQGWLLTFIATLTIGNPIAYIISVLVFQNQWSQMFDKHPELFVVGLIKQVIGILLMAASILVGYKLWQMRPKAETWARAFIFIFGAVTIGIAFWPFFANFTDEMKRSAITDWSTIIDIVRGVIYSGVCYIYLVRSRQVAALYGRNGDDFSNEEVLSLFN